MKRSYRIQLVCLTILIGTVFLGGGALTELLAQESLDKVEKYERQRNVKKLIAVMQDGNTPLRVRQEAASALGRLKDIRSVEPLITCLRDKDLRKYSAWALGNSGDRRAVEPLVVVLTDDSSIGREEAGQALSKLGWEAADDREKIFFLAARRDWDACVAFGSSAIEPLVSMLGDGPDSARIGAVEALDRLDWKPDEENREAYDAAKALKAERGAIIDMIVVGEMKLKQEYEINLQKLREDYSGGHLDLSEEEFKLLEGRFNQDIVKEQEEVESFRSALSQSRLSITRFGEEMIIGTEPEIGEVKNPRDQRGVIVYQENHDPGGKLIEDIWYGIWTEKPTKMFVWETGEFYRFKSNGEKYLFAKVHFGQAGRGLILSIDLLTPDGGVREIISFVGRSNPHRISTKIGPDKLIEWPGDVKWAIERLKLLEVMTLAR